jgi:hypothetical protein
MDTKRMVPTGRQARSRAAFAAARRRDQQNLDGGRTIEWWLKDEISVGRQVSFRVFNARIQLIGYSFAITHPGRIR